MAKRQTDEVTGASAAFRRPLSTRRSLWQAGLLLQSLLRLVGGGAVLLVAYGLLDFFLALPPAVRVVLDITLLTVLGGLLLLWIARIGRIGNADMAQRADRLLGNRRRAVQAAFEIERWLRGAKGATHDLRQFLSVRSVAHAGRLLKGLGFRRHFPFPELGRQLKVLTLQLCLAGMLLLSHRTASWTVLRRLALPLADIPPYSRYTFTVSPETPEILYGGTADVAVELTGGPVRSQVWFMTRYQGKVHRNACFQETPRRFAQRLAKVVSPVEFCFAMGRSRSHWHRVDLLLQPQIAIADATVTPPPYARQPAQQFFIGNKPLAGLRHSRVELSVTSNRPLLDGTLSIKPTIDDAPAEVVTGTKTGTRTVTFSWALATDADLAVAVRDMRGTRNREPFTLRQTLVPDAPPETRITQPGGFTLATPNTTIPLEGYAADDLGLRRVDLVRAVVGYRDRPRPIGPPMAERRFDFAETLDLRTIGAEPGQVLEFYLEASDLNPSMMGTAASDVVRVQVIGEDEYAAMLRARTTVEAFLNRYRVAEDRLNRLKDALRELAEAASAPDADPARLGELLNEAQQRNQAAADLFAAMADDFPVYDVEQGLAEALKGFSDVLQSNREKMDALSPPYKGAGAQAEQMLSDLGEPEKRLRKEVADSEEVAMVANVMECATRFKALVARQAELVRRLARFAEEPRSRDVRLLSALGRREAELREQLETLARDLATHAAKLPNTYRTLRSSAEEFAKLIREYEIPSLMAQSTGAADNQDGEQAHHFAVLALEKLEAMMAESRESDFGGMCQGEMRFEVRKDLKSTLRQIMAGMSMRMGGAGQGQGEGAAGAGLLGGSANDGYWMGGHSPLNVPMFGPGRTALPGASEFGTTGTGAGAEGAGPARIDTRAVESMTDVESVPVESESLPLDEVPPKYREAVKHYFSSRDGTVKSSMKSNESEAGP